MVILTIQKGFDGFKQSRCLPSLFFNFALQYVFKKVHENKEEFKLNAPDKFLVHADAVTSSKT
jgi:hypothetical protein